MHLLEDLLILEIDNDRMSLIHHEKSHTTDTKRDKSRKFPPKDMYMMKGTYVNASDYLASSKKEYVRYRKKYNNHENIDD